MNLEKLLSEISAIAKVAGAEAMEIYATDFAIYDKEDKSPVTEADERVEAVILARLAELTPDIPVISEEAAAAGHIPDVDARFWLVDPLDGTKEFIKRNGEFTVNIALVEQGRPVLGVVYAPALDRLFRGAQGVGAYLEQGGVCRPITCRQVPAAGLTVVGSRSHGDPEAMDRFLAGRTVVEQKSAGSSLKFCLVAAGEADLYPRLGRTMEWDTAAGHAVLLAAGGSVNTLEGAALLYGKPGLDNPHFVAAGAVA